MQYYSLNVIGLIILIIKCKPLLIKKKFKCLFPIYLIVISKIAVNNINAKRRVNINYSIIKNTNSNSIRIFE